MNKILIAAKYLVIAGIIGFAAFQITMHKSDQRKIMIVHSYYNDMPWVNEIDEGVARALDNHRGESSKIQIRTHYMNLKNHPDCDYYSNQAHDAYLNIKNWQPDAIVIFDDLAQALVGFNFTHFQVNADETTRRKTAEEMLPWLMNSGQCTDKKKANGESLTLEDFSLHVTRETMAMGEYKPTIIFAGVNGTITRYGYDHANHVFGIFEHKNYEAILDTLVTLKQSLNSEATVVRQLNDTSATAQVLVDLNDNGNQKTSVENIWHSKGLVESEKISANDFYEWRDSVIQADQNNEMLLISNYQNLTVDICDNQQITMFSNALTDSHCLVNLNDIPDEAPNTNQCTRFDICADALIQWTDLNSTQFPPLGTNTNFVSDGGMMTLVVSGIEQGEVAMEKALTALFDTTQTIENSKANRFAIGLNQSLLEYRNISLPAIYPSYSKELGRFINFSETQYFSRELNTNNEQ